MEFHLPENRDKFEIPDGWWDVAQMRGFSPSRSAFRWQMHEHRHDVELRPIAVIETPRRGPNFGFPLVEGRLIRILQGIRDDQLLPAIGVTPLHDTSGPFAFKLYCGFHRFYASAAVGFTHVPSFIRGHDD